MDARELQRYRSTCNARQKAKHALCEQVLSSPSRVAVQRPRDFVIGGDHGGKLGWFDAPFAILKDMSTIVSDGHAEAAPDVSCDMAGLVQQLKAGATPSTRKHLWMSLLRERKEATIVKVPRPNQAIEPHSDIHVDVEGYLEEVCNLDEYFLFKENIKANVIRLIRCDPHFTSDKEHLQHGSVISSPVCYVSQDPNTSYTIFHHAFDLYFRHLTPHTNGSGDLQSLCGMFELMVQLLCPEEVLWLRSKKLQISDIARTWFANAFVGHLRVEQVLRLWDLVFAYDDVVVMALLAVSIVSVKRHAIQSVSTHEELQVAFQDVDQVQVLQALQRLYNKTTKQEPLL